MDGICLSIDTRVEKEEEGGYRVGEAVEGGGLYKEMNKKRGEEKK